jgi:hypothetical protein
VTWTLTDGRTDEFVLNKVVFASFARSGAEIIDGLLQAQNRQNDFIGAGQLEECRRAVGNRPIDALLISIGGNDVGFSGVLRDLVAGDSYYALFSLPGQETANRQAVQARLDELLGVNLPAGQRGELEANLETLDAAIRDQLVNGPGVRDIYISGYPTDLFYVRGEGGQIRFRVCELFESVTPGVSLDISPADGELLRSRGRMLNSLIQRKAGEFGWHYVDVADDFEGNGYCTHGPTRMFIHAEESCKQQLDWEGTMHPNARGHAAYGLRLSEAMRRFTFNPF